MMYSNGTVMGQLPWRGPEFFWPQEKHTAVSSPGLTLRKTACRISRLKGAGRPGCISASIRQTLGFRLLSIYAAVASDTR